MDNEKAKKLKRVVYAIVTFMAKAYEHFITYKGLALVDRQKSDQRRSTNVWNACNWTKWTKWKK